MLNLTSSKKKTAHLSRGLKPFSIGSGSKAGLKHVKSSLGFALTPEIPGGRVNSYKKQDILFELIIAHIFMFKVYL